MTTLWIDFVNSDWRDHVGRGRHEDRLEKPEWTRAFLARWELGRLNLDSRETQTALRDLRSLLQRFVSTLVEGRRIGVEDLDALNGYLAAREVRSRLEKEEGSFRVRLVPTAQGLDAVLFAIAVSFAELLVQGDASRLRICDNPHCGWVFYDTTRSRTRRWCDDGCGNLMKVRRFRKRKRSTGAATGRK
ncbi:MAG: CGNR zinc finger domain-containing protein [Planctomycetota bacterium]|jgi:predicted RNA-binding Zn ribbon-like protein